MPQDPAARGTARSPAATRGLKPCPHTKLKQTSRPKQITEAATPQQAGNT